ncbi:MAG TPA: hypothetical protein VNI34_03895 [Candidatus Nitrosotalea sp.]|nr:hypothetical protein [Candidatus Nitrosotalea sp.]
MRALVPKNGAAEPPPEEVAPAAEDGKDHDLVVMAQRSSFGAIRPRGYDRALRLVRDAELAVTGAKDAGKRACDAHDHALLVALRMGKRAGRSLRAVARDSGTSYSHLSRLVGCRNLTLPYTRTSDLPPEELRERFSISRVRHLLGQDPATQRRGMQMLVTRPYSERAMRDFVSGERASLDARPNPQTADLRRIARTAIAKGEEITVKTSPSSSPGRVVLTIRLTLPQGASELVHLLPRGNSGPRRSQAA